MHLKLHADTSPSLKDVFNAVQKGVRDEKRYL